MTTPSLPPEWQDAAREAAVKAHFDAMQAAGLSVPYEQISERSRRIVANQQAHVVAAVLDVAAAAVAEAREQGRREMATVVLDNIDCYCDEAYTKRGLVEPGCQRHDVENAVRSLLPTPDRQPTDKEQSDGR